MKAQPKRSTEPAQSGSMQGAPETVAKAVTLEAVRIANAEKRDCFLYAFSGPKQVAEFDLTTKRGGVQALLEFLGCSFHGGTDVAEPMGRALKRVESAKWSRADIIVVSDGEFPIPGATTAAVSSARSGLQLRVHGLLIGAGHSSAMSALCDPVHVFNDWNALGVGRIV
ncbi:MAG: VWA domain-containing protein [Phycisphaeraceae bacterium]|nr:VWA domain-containing protein [Phycisphaeraceae bacterium]